MKLASWTALALAFAIGQAGSGGVPRLETASPRTPTSAARPPLEIEADQTVDLHKLDAIEPLVQAAIAEKKLPGRGRADRARRSHPLPEGDRQPRARAGGRADDARHDLRSGVAHEGGRDDDQRDDAGRGRQDPPERSRGDVHPGLRALRQGRHHDPPPDDAHVRASGPIVDLGEAWTGSDTAIALADRGSADVACRPAVRLQRHQLLPARRHRPARERAAARPVRASRRSSSRSA